MFKVQILRSKNWEFLKNRNVLVSSINWVIEWAPHGKQEGLALCSLLAVIPFISIEDDLFF